MKTASVNKTENILELNVKNSLVYVCLYHDYCTDKIMLIIFFPPELKSSILTTSIEFGSCCRRGVMVEADTYFEGINASTVKLRG